MPPVASLVAKDIIDAARDLHPVFDRRRHPGGVLLRALSRYQRTLAAQIIQYNPSVLTQVQTTNLPLPDFDAGVTLPDFKYPAGVEAEMPPESGGTVNRKHQVDLVPWQARFRWHLGAFIRNNTLYLTGTALDWVGFQAVRFYYVPEAETLNSETDVLVLPNAVEPCLTAYLGHVMAQRSKGDPTAAGLDAREFRVTWREAEDQLLDEMGRHEQATTSVIHESF
jgi:hypothetical protein